MLKILFIGLFLFGVNLQADDDRHFPRDLKKLELSSEQNTQLKDLFKSYHKLRKEHEEDEEDFEERLEKMFKDEDFKKEDFIEIKSDLYHKAIRIEAEILAKVHTILSPKQRREFAKDLEEWEIE